MSRNDEHNGWRNYETFVVDLWMSNEEPSQLYWTERAEECLRDENGKKRGVREAAAVFTEMLKEEHEEQAAEACSNNVFADLLGASMEEVDWDRIAKKWIDIARDQQKRGR